VSSYEIKVPPAKAWWCPAVRGPVSSYEIEVPPAEAWWYFKQVQSTKIKNPSTTLANTLQS